MEQSIVGSSKYGGSPYKKKKKRKKSFINDLKTRDKKNLSKLKNKAKGFNKTTKRLSSRGKTRLTDMW